MPNTIFGRFFRGAFAAAALFLVATQAHAWQLSAENVTSDACSGQVTVDFVLSDPTGPVDALGFDIFFNNECVTYTSIAKGPLVADWALVTANVQGDGELRVGAIPLFAAPFDEAGLLVTVTFTLNCTGDTCISPINPKDLVDDLQNATVVNGSIVAGVTVEGEGEGAVEGVLEGEGEGTVEGSVEGEGEGTVEGLVEGEGEGTVEGVVEGEGEGTVEGAVEGEGEGTVEGGTEGEGEGTVEGSNEGDPEGSTEGDPEGEPVDLPPVVNCQNITVPLTVGFVFLTPAQLATASDDNGVPTLTIEPSLLNCENIGANTVTVTARDSANQVTTCTATVTVEDTEAPIAACKNFATVLGESNSITISAESVNDNSRDACGGVTLELSKTEFTCADLGDNTVTLTVTDESGNEATCTANVFIGDPLNACAELPSYSLSVTAQGNGTATIETEPNATDGLSYTEGTSVVVRATPNAGARFAEWTGDTQGGTLGQGTITVVMTQDRSITAVFEVAPVQGCGSFPSCNIQGPPTCNIQGAPTCNEEEQEDAKGDLFLGALTLGVLLALTAYQKRNM